MILQKQQQLKDSIIFFKKSLEKFSSKYKETRFTISSACFMGKRKPYTGET